MGKTLRFTKIELTNAAKVACTHGVTVRLEVDGSMIIQPPDNSGDSGDKSREAVDEITESLL